MPPAVLERFERIPLGLDDYTEAWRAESRPRPKYSDYRLSAPKEAMKGVRKYTHFSTRGESRLPQREPWEALPSRLGPMQAAIEKSRYIIELEDDWDGEGSVGVDKDTWERAVSFLARHALLMWRQFGRALDVPDICPGPEGSIDLHWDARAYEMLVNIRADPAAMAGFYGDDRGRVSIKGRFDMMSSNEGLMLWLKKAT